MFLKSQEGMGVVEIMVAAGLFGLLALGGVSVKSRALLDYKFANTHALLQLKKLHFVAVLSHEGAISAMAKDNPEMRFLVNPHVTAPSEGNRTIMRVMGLSSEGQPYDVLNASEGRGVDMEGHLCSGFIDSDLGNDACPFQFIPTFTSDCPGGLCASASFSLKLKYRPGKYLRESGFKINVEEYAVDNYKVYSQLAQVVSGCQQLQGAVVLRDEGWICAHVVGL